MKILVAEDDFTSRSILTAILKNGTMTLSSRKTATRRGRRCGGPTRPNSSCPIGTCREWTGWKSADLLRPLHDMVGTTSPCPPREGSEPNAFEAPQEGDVGADAGENST
jgi:hypothetical protein